MSEKESHLYHDERKAICEYGVELLQQGLTTGTGGNLSIRVGDEYIAISPSGIPYDDIAVWDVPVVDFDGSVVTGDCDPSTELPMHLAVYEQRDDVEGVVHTHSPYATTFAALGEPIPASHYLVAFAGTEVPIARYETHATPELGTAATEALGDDYKATLLKHHGVLTTADSIASAFDIALMVEYCARIHHLASTVGDPDTLSNEEISRIQDKLQSYGTETGMASF